MSDLRTLKVPLRQLDKLLLIAVIWILGAAVAFFWSAPPVREQVITETRTTSWLTTETRTAAWTTAETRISTTTVTTVSPTTRTITSYTTITQVVTSIAAFGTIYYTYYIPVMVTHVSVSQVSATRTHLVGTTVAHTETAYSTVTFLKSGHIEVVHTQRVLEPPLIQTAFWIAIGVVVLGLTYRRINEYRTRLHIYYEILRYVSQSPRIASHIMRRCNLETGKFNKYINELQFKGFVNIVQRGDTKEYAGTEKSFEYLRDEKLARFITELS